jgi:hypothetical protein
VSNTEPICLPAIEYAIREAELKFRHSGLYDIADVMRQFGDYAASGRVQWPRNAVDEYISSNIVGAKKR